MMKQGMTVRVIALLMLLMSLPLAAKVSGLPDFTELVEETGPAVVNIRVTQFGNRGRQEADREGRGETHPEIPEFFRRYFDVPDGQRPRRPDRTGAGSGFIYTEDGYILTNHHVVEDADEIIVRMADRHEFVAELIGSDEASDIAVLKIESDESLPFLRLGDSESLKPGEWVAAIGSPFNFEQSVTAGIVSAKGRSNMAQQYVPFIQSDVAINRGNSGGPLLNMEGEVVGINSWILSSSGGYIGLSFSIPVEVAASTASQLRETGKVERGLLGVVVEAVDRELAEALGLERPVGALVNTVTEDGAAERAGIQVGDVILEFNGEELETWNDLPPLVGANPPGTEATVLVSRYGEKKTFEVTLDALDGDDNQVAASGDSDSQTSNVLGLVVEEIGSDRRRELGDPEGGVVVTDVESDAAWRAGLRPGHVILMINSRAVEDMDGFMALVADLEPNRAVALRIWANGTANFIAYTPRVEEE